MEKSPEIFPKGVPASFISFDPLEEIPELVPLINLLDANPGLELFSIRKQIREILKISIWFATINVLEIIPLEMLSALALGSNGFLSLEKEVELGKLLDTMTDIKSKKLNILRKQEKREMVEISEREKQTLYLMSKKVKNPAIAEILRIAPKSLGAMLNGILQKLPIKEKEKGLLKIAEETDYSDIDTDSLDMSILEQSA